MHLKKETLKKFIEDYENDPITKKWIDSVDNRGKFQRDLDKEFYDLSRFTINKLVDLIIFMNALHVGAEKITDSIQVQQEKYLDIVTDLEKQINRLKNGNKG
tara:strand:- start:4412 stop:4717 length:306 start_codon:yes stop_codon:yes gene_type:complete